MGLKRPLLIVFRILLLPIIFRKFCNNTFKVIVNYVARILTRYRHVDRYNLQIRHWDTDLYIILL